MTAFLKTGLLKLVESNLRNANQIRCYARWSHRHPRRVLTPEEYNELETKSQKNVKINVEEPQEKIIELNAEEFVRQQPKAHTKRPKTQPKQKWVPQSNEQLINMTELDQKSEIVNYKIEPNAFKTKKVMYKSKKTTDNAQDSTDMLETVIDANGEFIYTKLKDKDPVVSQLLLMVKSRKEQIKKDLALLEGKRLIKEALQANCTLKNLIFSRKNDLEYLKPYLPKSGAKLYKMPYREIQMWSDLTTTPGIMGIFKTPEVENFVPKESLDLTIICDNVREPGNLGAILRTAAGVGAKSIILTKGCVDLWDTKVLRSACGAHFCLQIHKKKDWTDIKDRLNECKSTVLIADNKVITENASLIDQTNSLVDVISSIPLVPYYGVSYADLGGIVLVVGGETEGVSEDSYRLAADFNGIRLNIPLSNQVDSLNTGTALGVIMFEIRRQIALFQHKDEVVGVGNCTQ